MGNNVRKDIECGTTAQRAAYSYERSKNSNIIEMREVPRENQKDYDVDIITKNGSSTDELKHDQESVFTDNAYAELRDHSGDSGITTTKAKTWTHIIFHDGQAYAIRYEVEFFRKKCELEKKSQSGWGALIPKKKMFQDCKNGDAKIIWQMSINDWVQWMKKFGNIDTRWHRELQVDLIIPMEIGTMKKRVETSEGYSVEVENNNYVIFDSSGNQVAKISESALAKGVQTSSVKLKPKTSTNTTSPGKSLVLEHILKTYNNGAEFTTKEVMAATQRGDSAIAHALGKIDGSNGFTLDRIGPKSMRKYKLVSITG